MEEPLAELRRRIALSIIDEIGRLLSGDLPEEDRRVLVETRGDLEDAVEAVGSGDVSKLGALIRQTREAEFLIQSLQSRGGVANKPDEQQLDEILSRALEALKRGRELLRRAAVTDDEAQRVESRMKGLREKIASTKESGSEADRTEMEARLDELRRIEAEIAEEAERREEKVNGHSE